MGITDVLSGWYAKAEEKFYKLMDWFELKGVPIYNYNDFLESRGIPVFPFTIALIAIIAITAFWLFTVTTSVAPTLSLSIKDSGDNTLGGVNLSVYLNEKKIFDDQRSHAGEIKLNSMPLGSKLEVRAKKPGFEETITVATVNEQRVAVEIAMQKITTPITGLLKVVDEKTGLPVKGALVTATWGTDFIRQVETDENGLGKLDGVPQGEKLKLSIKADNFEEISDLVSFEGMQTQTISIPAQTTAMFGQANLLVTVFDKETASALDDVSIKIFDSEKDALLFEGITQDGQYLAQLPKGTVVRVVAAKSSYIKFDSTASAAPITIREDEEALDIYLEKGGQKIRVNIKQKDSLLPIIGATVSLFEASGKLLDWNKSGFSGTVEFSGLNSDNDYFIAAYLEGYIGDWKKVNPGATSETDLVLEIANEQNSASLNAYVYSANGDAAENATVNLFEIKEDGIYPTGAPALKTEYDGFATIKMPVGKNILARAAKGIESGEASKTIVAMTENAVAIRMQLSSTTKTLLVYAGEGTMLESGYAQITTAAEDSLFDGNFGQGTIVFDSRGNKTANVSITTEDGNIFTEQITIPDSNEPIKLNLGKENNNALAPQIKFLGIIDSEGKTANSLSPGQEYWLKFETSWIKGTYNGGIHARIGSDEIRFADSEDVGITGFSAVGADSFYGRSWNSFPAPGNEGTDFRNAGKPGTMNKWVELYYSNPEGVKIIKVKVRARENATMQATMLHYRAWAVIGNNFERNPIDNELGKLQYTDTKTGLYAETIDTELSLFATEAKCEKQFCVSYNFVDTEGKMIPATEFKAIKDKVFALEATIKSAKTVGALIKASTQKEKPKLGFTGVEVESFTEFMDNNSTQSSIEVNDLSLVENAERRVRFYFKPKFTGNASIKTQLIADEAAVNDEFYFNIYEERLMTATIIPETISVGTDFSAHVRDADGKGIENATLLLKNGSGSIVSSMNGDASANNGANGEYFFKNTFGAGTYSLEITAQTFTPIMLQVPIGSNDALRTSEAQIRIIIPKGERTGTAMLQLENLSGLEIQNIDYSFEETGNFPIEMEFVASIPEALYKGGKARVEASALYNGDANKTVHAEADLTIRGSVAGKYPTTTKVRVVAEYNQRLDSSCLEFDRKEIAMALAGEGEYDSSFSNGYYNRGNNYATYPYGTTYDYSSQYPYTSGAGYNYPNQPYSGNYNNTISSAYGNTIAYSGDGDSVEESIIVKNNCGIALDFAARAMPRSNAQNEQIDVQVDGFSLEPNQSKTITVTATNKVLRRYDAREQRNYDIVFSAPQLEKQLPLTLTLWDKRFALAVRNSIVLWLSQGNKSEPVIASTPLFIKNIGEADIKDISINIDNANWEGVTIRIAPPGTTRGQILPRGADLVPLRIVVAEMRGGTAKGKLIQGFLTISGTINGRRHDLARVNVWIHVSALNCLKAYPVSDLDFESTITGIGVIDKKISVRNTCEEAVRIADVEPNQIGANSLAIVPLAAEILERDAEAEFLLRLTKGYDYKSDNVSIAVLGLTMLTHKFISSDRVNARVSLGEKAVETGLASAPYSVNVCNPDGTISQQKKQVRFPIISKTPDCTKAYCDAELAAEFIAKKITEKIEQVQGAVDRGNGEIANFPGCASIYLAKACGFARMGIKSDSFDLYMGNDNLTDALVKSVFNEKTPELRNYNVSYCAGKQCEVEAVAATGFPNLMYLSDSLRGCGKYRVTIDGAVFASGMKIQDGGYTIAVNVSSKQTTPECTNKITNAMNFLPQDAGQIDAASYGAWPGMVEASSELSDAGKMVAKELFGKEERYNSGTGSNKLSLSLGEMKSGIVRLEMQQEGTAAEPKAISAIINQSVGTGAEAIQKEIAKEAANAIASLKTQRLEEGKSCVSEDDSFMVIGSYTKFGEITITGPSQLKMKQGNANLSDTEALKAHSCIDLNINSKIAEEVFAKTNAKELENRQYGIEKVYLRAREKNSGRLTVLDEKTIAKLQQDEKTREYKYELQLCVIASGQMSLAKKGIDVKVWAENRFDALRKVDPPKTIKAIPCAIHPYDLLENLSSEKDGTYYATVGWNGEPDSVAFSTVLNNAVKNRLYKDAEQSAIVSTGTALGPAFESKEKSDRRDAIIYNYMVACSVVSAACIADWKSGLKKVLGIGLVAGPLLDCVPPAAWAMAQIYPDNIASQAITGSVDFTIDLLKKIWPGNWDATKDNIQQQASAISAPNVAKQETETDLVQGATASIAAHGIGRGIKYGNYIGKFGAKKIASGLTNDVVDEIISKQTSGLTAVAEKEIRKALKETIYKEMEKAIIDAQKAALEAKKPLTELELKAAVEKASANIDAKKLSKSVADVLYKNRAKLTGDLGKGLDGVVEKAFAGKTAEDNLLKNGFTNITKDKAENTIFNAIKDQSNGLKYALSSADEDSIRRIIAEHLDLRDYEKLPVRGTPSSSFVKVNNFSKEEIETIVSDVIKKNSNLKAGVETALKKEASTVVGSITKELGSDAVKPETIRVKAAKFARSFVRGAICGAAANFAGYLAFEKGYSSKIKQSMPTTEFVGSKADEIGRAGKIVDDLVNGETYRIQKTETKDEKGQAHKVYEVQKVKDLSGIPANSEWIDGDCEGKWAEKGISAVLYSLAPEKEKVGAQAAVLYYDFAEEIAKQAALNSVPEEMIVTALVMESKYRDNIPGNCGDWTKTTKDATPPIISCVAAKLKSLNKPATTDNEIRELFKAYHGQAVAGSDDYSENALFVYRQWQGAKISLQK